MGIKKPGLPLFEAVVERNTADGYHGRILPHRVDLVPAQQELDILKVRIKEACGVDRSDNRHYILTM
jgi:hypothetical protein